MKIIQKFLSVIYAAILLLVMLIPLAAMPGFATDTTTENRTLAQFPEIMADGTFNINFLRGLGDWFNDRFAFRQVLVDADARVLAEGFGVSTADTVLVGTDGWLYYTDTLDDYLGRNVLGERGRFSVIRNLTMIQDYVEEHGASFLFTIAPNKNSLYGEHMPAYYDCKISEENTADLLVPMLQDSSVKYADLFSMFRETPETLYLRRDSHWNNKGALAAYDRILSALEIDHDAYEMTEAVRTRDTIGDLNGMLFPISAQGEWNIHYRMEQNWAPTSDMKSVEDAWITTENKKAEGSLLMYRDSFGNTLLPFFANAFAKAAFSKGVPYALASHMAEVQPDAVIVEKVERNLREYVTMPAIIPAPRVEVTSISEGAVDGVTLAVEELEYDPSYWTLSGEIPQEALEADSRILVRIEGASEDYTVEAYCTVTDGGENGYLLYLPKDIVPAGEVKLSVLTENSGDISAVYGEQIDFSEIHTMSDDEEEME